MPLNPKRDPQTVTPQGERISPLIDGVQIRYALTHADERGTLTEIFNPAWAFTTEPLVYVYEFTIRPGKVKGWVVHYEQDDRIFLVHGAIKIVLYDAREHAPTHKMINEIVLTEHHRALVTYPRGVYHAIQNLGTTDALLINMPTRPYHHENPDKYRLPLNTDEIPYRFENTLGW